MIHDKQNVKYLTDEQLFRLMELVRDEKPIELHMPSGEGCPVDLTRDGRHYVIKADGTFVYDYTDKILR